MRRAVLIAAAAISLSGCIATLPVGTIDAGGKLVPLVPGAPVPAGSGERPLDFRLRIIGPGARDVAKAEGDMANLIARNSSLQTVSAGASAPADVELRWSWARDATGVRIEAVSAHTGETLFRCQDAWWSQASAGRNIGAMLATAFVPGGELYKKVVAQRGARPAAPGGPAVATAPAALSSEQIAQIVQQTLQAKAAPAPDPGPREAPKYKLPADPDKFAVVVGVENYVDLPPASYAERDAAAVKEHLIALGYPERNIVSLTGGRATMSGLVKSLETWLPRNAGPESTVAFYFSGHGAPDPSTGQAYIMPADGDPQFLNETAYPTKRLYAALGKLKAKRVLVVMDACFSGAGGRSVLAKGTRPLVAKIELGRPDARIVSLAAAGANEITGADESAKHGLFTYYLLRGLNGAARDGAGRVTARGLIEYAAPNVQDAARRQNRDQTPALAAGAEDDFPLR